MFHIDEVPSFSELAVLYSSESSAGEFCFPAACRNTEVVSKVGHGCGEMSGNAIALCNDFFHGDVQVWESPAKIPIHRLESFRADEAAAGFREIMRNAIGRQHLVDG